MITCMTVRIDDDINRVDWVEAQPHFLSLVVGTWLDNESNRLGGAQ